MLAVKDITPLEGGLPVILDGTIIGAIGVSGRVRTRLLRASSSCSGRGRRHDKPRTPVQFPSSFTP